MKYVYTVDLNHTTIGFSARHLMVTTIRGKVPRVARPGGGRG
jgi:polyisoprenoid-binding protein YceI